MKYLIYVSLFLLSVFAKADNLKSDLARDGYFGVYGGFGVDRDQLSISEPLFEWVYAGKFMTQKYTGSFGAGSSIVSDLGFLFIYEYDFLYAMDDWGLGVDTTFIFGPYGYPKASDFVEATHPKKSDEEQLALINKMESRITLTNTIGLFVEKPVAQSVSILLKSGLTHSSTLKDFSVKAKNIDFYIKLGVKFHYDRIVSYRRGAK